MPPSHKNRPTAEHHQNNFNEDEWSHYMTIKIENAFLDADTHKPTEISMISTPHQALLEVKPLSYCPEILTIGPLYIQNLGESPLDHRKGLCVKIFMERHGLSDVKVLMQRLIPDWNDLNSIYFNLPKYRFECLQLMVTIDTVFIHELLLFVWNECNSQYFKVIDIQYFTTVNGFP